MVGQPRGIDHLVVTVRDLDAAGAFYESLGFTVGARNRHPWGTENRIVQFPGAFLELITVGDGTAIPPHGQHLFSFGAFVRDFIAGGEGAAMLALESRNAIADAEAFRLARIGDFEPFFFERQGVDAAGQPVRVSFTLAFAEPQELSRVGFFTCQQHQPQNFWSKSQQIHANGVESIHSVVFVCDDPSDYHEFLGHFIGQREMRATSFGLELDTGRGMLEVLSPDAFAFRFGQPAPSDPQQGLQLAAIRLHVGDRKKSQEVIGSAAVQIGALTIVPASQAGGVVLAFA